MLEAWAITSAMVVSRVHTSGGQVFTRYIGRDESAIAVCCHHTMRSRLDLVHNNVGIVDRHVLVIRIWFATTQELGQVNRQKADVGQATTELIGQELGYIHLLAMTISIGGTNLWYRHAQVGAF